MSKPRTAPGRWLVVWAENQPDLDAGRVDVIRASVEGIEREGLDVETLLYAMNRVSDAMPGDLIIAYRLNDTTPREVAEAVAREYALALLT